MKVNNRKVLIVDDIAVNRLLLSEVMELLGYTHSEARNGKEAIDKLQKQDFFLVLMDVEMPVMNGIEATQHIKKMPHPYDETIVIGVTAHNPRDFASDFDNAGFDAFITKPYTAEKIEKALTQYYVAHNIA